MRDNDIWLLELAVNGGRKGGGGLDPGGSATCM